jgi:hypothetical protein
MADMTKTVPGTLSLPEIERAIMFEEKKSFELLASRIDANKENQVDFTELELGSFPKDLKLTLDSDSPPAGYARFLDSPLAMTVGGSRKSVFAWRRR